MIQKASGEPLVDLESLSARYARKGPDVLKGVSLRVSPGDVVAVMGENGSGKSTLLYALLGELKPSSGSGTVLGKDVRKRARRRRPGEIAMLFQNPDLMLLSDRVDEEVSAGPRNLGWSEEQVRRTAAETMDALGVRELSMEPPLALSRGQRLRVALASILSMSPRLLLLDEPTTGQDRLQIESMMDHLVETLGEKGVIFCTHDILTAARYANKVLVLSGGEVLACGAPKDVFADLRVMSAAGLHAPVAAQIARALELPAVISVDELVRLLAGGGRR
jgi:energy-coupling factor transport system ATP-binding protein